MDDSNSIPSDIAHDDLCPICHLLIYEPVKTSCGHHMCCTCFAQWADMSASTSPSDLDPEVDYDPDSIDLAGLEVSCPMCRTMTKASLHIETRDVLQSKYPAAYAERRQQELEANRQEMGGDGIERFTIVIGNRHHLTTREPGTAGGNRHDWTFFVKFSKPELVRSVNVRLHPTFRPPEIRLLNQPFEVRRLGWGVFQVRATVELKPPYQWVEDGSTRRAARSQSKILLDWMLQFDEPEAGTRVRMKIKKLVDETT